jgi:hypothetical protein
MTRGLKGPVRHESHLHSRLEETEALPLAFFGGTEGSQ